MSASHKNLHSKLSIGGLLITLGIIYGDIGTSPLYVMKAILGSHTINADIVLGGISCVFWTLTLQTTIKYVLITLSADNHGEGGIFALYALVKKTKSKKKNYSPLPIMANYSMKANGSRRFVSRFMLFSQK